MNMRRIRRGKRGLSAHPARTASNGRAASRRSCTASFSLACLFETQAQSCHADANLFQLLEAATGALGFDYFALVHHASLEAGTGPLIRLHNYPASWEDELIGEGLAPYDPVHQASERTNLGFPWSQLPALLPLSPRQKRILERSGYHGIGEGFTVPGNVPGEPAGSVSFATRRGRALPQARLPEAQLIGAQAFAAARRLCGYPARASRPHLSRRQLQCLRLLARGKTDWEIAAILGLGVETARHYVKSARAAYDVTSRTQLVVHALRDARISFDDAIPPGGGMG